LSRPDARVPDLVQQRGDRHLLVWAEVGAWLVGDDQLVELVRRLDGRDPLPRVARDLARRWGRPVQEVLEEVGQAVDALRSMGVIGPVGAADDSVSIANVTVNVTNRCNLRCTHCYNAPQSEELDAGELTEALLGIRPVLAAGASLILLGGEPLLAPQRVEVIVQGTRELFDVPPMLSTNGTLVDESIADRVAALDVDVQVSLDGPDAATHDPVRGEGTFDRAVGGVRRLRGAGVDVTLSMVYDRTNLDRMEAYLDLALELDAREVRFIPLRLIGRAAAHPERAPDQLAALHHVLGLLDRRPEARGLLHRDFFTITREVCRRGGARTNCGIGRQVVFLDADGSVYPCPNHRIEAMRCGDVRQEALDHIVRSSPVMTSVRHDYRVDRYPRCRDCLVRPWCAGDCRGEVLSMHGDVRGDAPHCEQMRQLVVELMWLTADGDPRLAAPAAGETFV
jgi:radical SAM protein with 4Fe4S-binding SPASM domain